MSCLSAFSLLKVNACGHNELKVGATEIASSQSEMRKYLLAVMVIDVGVIFKHLEF